MIQKQRPPGNYTMIGNDAFKDMRLDLTDRGLLATLMSLPDNWNFSIAGLTKILPDGKGRIGKSLDRLQQFGYLEHMRGRNSKGEFTGTRLKIRSSPDRPEAENPYPENRDTDNRDTDNRDTDYRDTDYRDTDYRDTDYPAPGFQPQYKKDKYKNTTMKNNNHRRAKNSFQDFEQRSYPPEFYEKLERKMSGIRPEATG